MRIESVVVHRAALPLVRPFRTSFMVEHHKDVVLVELTTDAGVTGWGECVAMTAPLYSHEYNDGAIEVMREFLLPRLLGVDLELEDVPALLAPVRAAGSAASLSRRTLNPASLTDA